MTAYIYLSSDTPLMTSEIANEKTNNETITYFQPALIESFLSIEYFESKSQNTFGCSKHFSEAKYQVASPIQCFPRESDTQLKLDSKKALYELFNYLVDHFKNTQATYVEILFCETGSENKTLSQDKLVTYERLSVDDLYYAEQKFIRIDTQMSEFVFRRRTA